MSGKCRSFQGNPPLIGGNSDVPNWKPYALGRDEDGACAVFYEDIAAPGAVVEIDANLAVVTQDVCSLPDWTVICISIPVPPTIQKSRFGTIKKFNDLPRQQAGQFPLFEPSITVTKAAQGRRQTGQDSEDKNHHNSHGPKLRY